MGPTMNSLCPFISSTTGWIPSETTAPVSRPWPFATIPPYALAPVWTRKCVLSAFTLAIAAPLPLAEAAQGDRPAVSSRPKQWSRTWLVRRFRPSAAVVDVPGPQTFTLAFIASNSGVLFVGGRIRDGGGSL